MYNTTAYFARTLGARDKQKRKSRLIKLGLGATAVAGLGYLALKGKGSRISKPLVTNNSPASPVSPVYKTISTPGVNPPSNGGQRVYDVMNTKDLDDLMLDVAQTAKEPTKAQKRLALVQNPDSELAQLIARQQNNIKNKKDIRLYNRAKAKLSDKKTTRKEYREARAIVRNMEWGNKNTRSRKQGWWVSGGIQPAKGQLQNYFKEKGAFRHNYYHLADFSS